MSAPKIDLLPLLPELAAEEAERRKQLEALCKAAGIEHPDMGVLTAWIRTSVAIRRSVATVEGT